MRKLLSVMMAIAFCGICNAQSGNNQTGKILSAQEAKYVLAIFCQYHYSSCFGGKIYIPGTMIIKSVGMDQNTGGTYVSGIHSYQGQNNGDYVIFNKWYEPDLMNRKGGWETGQRLIQYKK